ncbi:nucleotide sugar dehydrogenase [Anatilimnocola sp. NA78]|uniref:nucleotide sugar dehydrogenase n=1 Tax=Anatilimnocola sp. NA78 TaxID=3415683 RepID=UPI003CE5328A
MTGTFSQLQTALKGHTATVGVIGLGYVGLPLVRTFVQAGFRTIGFDLDERKVRKLQAGESYIGHLPSEWIAETIATGKFAATADMDLLAIADAILICVPTPLNDSRDPDLTYVENTTREIAQRLRPGQLIVLESTTYPGTTRDIVLPILAERGLQLGSDFFLAYSPEREDPGNPNFSTQRIPKVVGGADAASGELADLLYSQAVIETVPVANCEIAEACKILENVYRAVNIAMVNELKVLFDRLDIDIWAVIAAAKTKPFGFQAFYPGPGLGGHCIPIDPFYLSWLARKHESPARFIELAGEINWEMPRYVVQKVSDALNDVPKPMRGSKIGILGVAYKKDVDDPRESPAFRLIEMLEDRGAIISYHDPHIPQLPKMRHYRVPELSSEALTPAWLAAQDAVVIVTDHTAVDYALVAAHAPLIIDTRNAMARVGANLGNVRRA